MKKNHRITHDLRSPTAVAGHDDGGRCLGDDLRQDRRGACCVGRVARIFHGDVVCTQHPQCLVHDGRTGGQHIDVTRGLCDHNTVVLEKHSPRRRSARHGCREHVRHLPVQAYKL